MAHASPLLTLAQAAHAHAVPRLGKRFDSLHALCGAALAEIEEGFQTLAATADRAANADPAARAAAHMLRSGGKRLRPLCVLIGARFGARPFDHAVREAGIAAELVHAATLLHDDVIDDGLERRGQPAARVLFGNAASVLAGDHLLVEALRRVEALAIPQALTDLIATIAAMVEAEAIQLAERGRFQPCRERWLEIARGKTAALFAWALATGARLGGLEGEALAALERTGEALGMAFQLTDDALDLDGDPAHTGKGALNDVREGRLGWPLIAASERDPSIAATIAHALAAEPAEREALAPAIAKAVLQAGGARAAREEAARWAERAKQTLATLPPCPARDVLHSIIDACVERNA